MNYASLTVHKSSGFGVQGCELHSEDRVHFEALRTVRLAHGFQNQDTFESPCSSFSKRNLKTSDAFRKYERLMSASSLAGIVLSQEIWSDSSIRKHGTTS